MYWIICLKIEYEKSFSNCVDGIWWNIWIGSFTLKILLKKLLEISVEFDDEKT
jgi:hypothetical protein